MALEKARVARRLAAAPPMPAPVFIVGHWRSGTTHLYNVLSRSPAFGWVPPFAAGLPWDFLGIVRPIRAVLESHLPRDRLIDNIPVTPDSPQEDELPLALMSTVSYYHGLFFPSRFEDHFNRGIFFDGCDVEEIAGWQGTFSYFLRKVALIQPGRPLLLKNPVHSARIPILRAMWPDARFIHIHRNPYVVYPSTRRTFGTLLKSFALQDYGHVDLDRFVLDLYPRLMNRLVEDFGRSAGVSLCRDPVRGFRAPTHGGTRAGPSGTMSARLVRGRTTVPWVSGQHPGLPEELPPPSARRDRPRREALGASIRRLGYAPPG